MKVIFGKLFPQKAFCFPVTLVCNVHYLIWTLSLFVGRSYCRKRRRWVWWEPERERERDGWTACSAADSKPSGTHNNMITHRLKYPPRLIIDPESHRFSWRHSWMCLSLTIISKDDSKSCQLGMPQKFNKQIK